MDFDANKNGFANVTVNGVLANATRASEAGGWCEIMLVLEGATETSFTNDRARVYGDVKIELCANEKSLVEDKVPFATQQLLLERADRVEWMPKHDVLERALLTACQRICAGDVVGGMCASDLMVSLIKDADEKPWGD